MLQQRRTGWKSPVEFAVKRAKELAKHRAFAGDRQSLWLCAVECAKYYDVNQGDVYAHLKRDS